MRIFLVFTLILSGCSSSSESSFPELSGNWKSGCFTSDSIDYWVTYDYSFSGGNFSQIRHFYDNSDCIGGMSGETATSTRNGFITYVEPVSTTSGLQAELYDFHYFLSGTSEVDYITKTGVLIENNTMYFAFLDGQEYEILFDLPLYKVTN